MLWLSAAALPAGDNVTFPCLVKASNFILGYDWLFLSHQVPIDSNGNFIVSLLYSFVLETA